MGSGFRSHHWAHHEPRAQKHESQRDASRYFVILPHNANQATIILSWITKKACRLDPCLSTPAHFRTAESFRGGFDPAVGYHLGFYGLLVFFPPPTPYPFFSAPPHPFPLPAPPPLRLRPLLPAPLFKARENLASARSLGGKSPGPDGAGGAGPRFQRRRERPAPGQGPSTGDGCGGLRAAEGCANHAITIFPELE